MHNHPDDPEPQNISFANTSGMIGGFLILVVGLVLATNTPAPAPVGLWSNLFGLGLFLLGVVVIDLFSGKHLLSWIFSKLFKRK